MPKYSTQYALFTTSTATLTVLGAYMLTDNTRQAQIVEVIMTGSGATTPADTAHRCTLAGLSFGATGGSTPITPIPWNPSASAALGNYGVNYTTEPTTYSAVRPVMFGFNQRGGMRWAVPQGEGFNIANAGATEKGAGVTVISSAAGVIDANMHFWQYV